MKIRSIHWAMPPALVALVALPLGFASAQDEACKIDGMFAEKIMTIRQNGVFDVNVVMEKMGTLPGLRTMIIAAYDVPKMQNKSAQQEMVSEFVNSWSVKCYKDGPTVAKE